MDRRRLKLSKKLKAIINVKGNWENNIDYKEAYKKGIYVLSAAPAMAPAVAKHYVVMLLRYQKYLCKS